MDRLTIREQKGRVLIKGESYCYAFGCQSGEERELLHKALEKLAYYEDMEEQLVKAYGNCDNILEQGIDLMIEHSSDVEIGDPIKATLLTDETVDKWERWKKAEKDGRLIELAEECK